MKVIIKPAKKIKNKIFAMPLAAAAMPVKPKTAAITDTMKKIIAHLNMMFSLIYEGSNNKKIKQVKA